MKMLRIPKLPKFKFSRARKQPPQKLEARLRASSAPTMDAYEEEEPQTKFTGALIVVAVLHFIAVGGIYAFNQIKASRHGSDVALTTPAKTTTQPAPAPKEAAAPEQPVAHPKAPAAAVAPVAPVAPVLKQRVYNVKPGDSLEAIAKTFKVSVSELKAANGLSSDVIRPGQVLNLPNAKAVTEAPAAPVKAAEPTETKMPTKTYTVKSGDRLIFIAKKYNVTQEDLVAFNKLKDPGKLQVGQTIKIPARKTN
jgi:LysM repeat protein